MMKKLSILFLSLAMIISLIACEGGSSVEYADPNIAASLVDSINKEQLAKDILSVVNKEEGAPTGLEITPLLEGTMEEAATAGEATIIVTVKADNYSNGLWDKDTRSITSGKITFNVTGAFAKTGTGYYLDIKTYTAESTEVIITDTSGDEAVEYKVKAAIRNGVASGIIAFEPSTKNFTVSGEVYVVVPYAKDVDITLDGKPVDYERLCKEVETPYAPGSMVTLDGVEILPAGLSYEFDEATGGYAIVADDNDETTPSGSVIIPSEIAGKPVTKIGEKAFFSSDVTSVSLPETIKVIDAAAFQGCSDLVYVNIPDSVEIIGEGAFSGCRNLAIELELPEGLKELGQSAFYSCRQITADVLVVPDGIATLNHWVFLSCTGIKAYVIPPGCAIEVAEVGTPWDNCWDWNADYTGIAGPHVFFFDERPEGTPEFVEWLNNNYQLCDEGSIYYNGEWNMNPSNPQPISE